jgi:glycolate oxidase FAD binding subunit
VLAAARAIRCGGRVVKNVTGYDLAKLFVGSYGTLGVIEWAWLRLRPRPSRHAFVSPNSAPAQRRRPCACGRPPADGGAAALVDPALYEGPLPADAARRLVVELAGDAAAVEQDRAALVDLTGACDADDSAIERSAAQAAGPCVFAWRRCRAPSRPRPSCCARRRHAGRPSGAGPAVGALRLEGPDDERGAERALRAAKEAARAACGVCLLEAAPLAARVGREVFSGALATLALERAVKRQYDPAGILNPGRFVGGL